MNRITEQELIKFFSEHGNEFTSKGKVKISKRGDVIMIDCLLEESDEERFERYELHEEGLGIDTVLEVYGIKSFEELQLLSEAKLWERYLAGGAAVVFTNGDGAEIDFRVVQCNTKVYSFELQFEAETDRVFDKIEDFKGFIDEHWEVLEERRCRRG